MTLSLKGTATALVTPFNQDGSVDLVHLRHLYIGKSRTASMFLYPVERLENRDSQQR